MSYDVVPLDNPNGNYGIGAVGELPKNYNLNDFLSFAAHKLTIKNFRYTNGKKGMIKRVAVCGGAGSEYFREAIAQNCDAYITADIKYHDFQNAAKEILLIDAGHYETEIFSLNEIKKRIDLQLKNSKDIKVYLYSGSTNPVIFYNN